MMSKPQTNMVGLQDRAKLINQISGRLKVINASSETAFLTIGENLIDFSKRSSEIAKQSSEVINLISEEGVKGTLDGLVSLFEKLKSSLDQSNIESKRKISSLEFIANLSETVQDILHDFKSETRSLKLFGTSTRIESVYLTNNKRGFENLADEVERLTIMIDQKTSNIIRKLKLLTKKVADTITATSSREVKLTQKIRSTLQLLEESLQSMLARQEMLAAAAGTNSVQSMMVNSNISSMVTSMQFQDITRQQIEHVVQTLDDLCNEEIFEDTGEPERDEQEYFYLSSEVCRLQGLQVEHTSQQLVSAVENIINNLKGVSGNLLELVAQSKTIASKESSQSYFSIIENCMEMLNKSVTENNSTANKLSEINRSLIDTVNGMTSFLASIREIGIDIERVAVNACIKAAHTGEEGAALGVLAESIQKLSLEVRCQTVAIGGILVGIDKVAQQIESGNRSGSSNDRFNQLELTQNMRDLLDSTKELNLKVKSLASDSDMGNRYLETNINKCIAEITVHHNMSANLQEIIMNLDELQQKPQQENMELLNSRYATFLEKTRRRYTMESERAIHESMDHDASCEQLATINSNLFNEPENNGNELGDNIELF